jgi:integrase/recombinase XerD
MSHTTILVLDDAASEQVRLLVGGFLAGYRSAHTRRNYAGDLRQWLSFCAMCGIDPLHARRTHVELFARNCEARGVAPSTASRKLATLAMFYKWLVNEEFATTSPMTNIRRPRVSNESIRLGLGRTELCDWLNAAEELAGYDYALACLLALNGLRIGEVCAANVENLGETRYHHTLSIIGKGGQPALVPLAPRTRMAVDQAIAGREQGPLILSRWGTRLNGQSGWRAVRRITRQAGISKLISPHSLRHSAITAALNAGVSLRDVQEFARHADPRTTIRYDRARKSLDRNATYTIAQYLAGAS